MPDHDDPAGRARPFWSGTISFGLVSIPVSLLPANRSGGLSLRMLAPDGTPLARRYYDPETDREVPADRLVRGFEVAPNEYVVVTDDELDALEPEKTRDIDLRRFVDRDAIPPIFFERAYFLTPDGASTKAYRLLAATMEQTNRAGIATFVMRSREYLVAIIAENGILRAETLRFPDEIRPVDEIGLPDPPKLDARRLRPVEKAIGKLTRRSLDLDQLQDEYARRLRDLAEAKRKKGEDVVAAPAEVGAGSEDDDADVIDLMEVLKRSLGRRDPHPEARPAPRDDEELAGLTRAQLYERARTLEVPGRSRMTKEELIRAITKTRETLALPTRRRA